MPQGLTLYIPVWLNYQFLFFDAIKASDSLYIPVWLNYQAGWCTRNGYARNTLHSSMAKLSVAWVTGMRRSELLFTFQYG